MELTSIQKGIDVIAKAPDGMCHYIEVKGETSGRITSKRYGKPFNPNQIWSHVSVALMKTVTDMNSKDAGNGKFGMAFPENHRALLQTIKPSLDILGIIVYLVSEKGVVVL